LKSPVRRLVNEGIASRSSSTAKEVSESTGRPLDGSRDGVARLLPFGLEDVDESRDEGADDVLRRLTKPWLFPGGADSREDDTAKTDEERRDVEVVWAVDVLLASDEERGLRRLKDLLGGELVEELEGRLDPSENGDDKRGRGDVRLVGRGEVFRSDVLELGDELKVGIETIDSDEVLEEVGLKTGLIRAFCERSDCQRVAKEKKG
jgi:hypothetical protein